MGSLNVLVTGGVGCIGARAVKKALTRGHAVRVPDARVPPIGALP